MALKFLNKKGWHTGSLRNIENVWKAEQKHEAEQRKLEELRKQIHEERERSEFRLLQEQAGLVPKQERLDFLYDSGLAVGKGNSDGFKALESLPPKAEPEQPSSANKASAPGALFEDKPQSANDAWRKLHSDPLLLIKQREQEALARVKNNPVQMAMIHKSVEAKKHKEKTSDGEKHKEKHHRKKLKHEKHTSSKHRIKSDDDDVGRGEEQRNNSSSQHSKYKENIQTERIRDADRYNEKRYHGEDHLGSQSTKRNKEDHFSSQSSKRDREDHFGSQSAKRDREDHFRSQSAKRDKEDHFGSQSSKKDREDLFSSESAKRDREDHSSSQSSKREREDHFTSQSSKRDREDHFKHLPPRHQKVGRQNGSVKLSEEERAAKLKEMQMDAEVHEEQRWKRLKQAADDDAKEATLGSSSGGRNFLDAAHKSVFGAEKGGSSTIEESVRRRTHYSQRRSGEENAFRR